MTDIEPPRSRRVRFRHAKPSVPLDQVPAEGIAPADTGNRLLDFNQSLVDEFESKTRRQEALLRQTWPLLRGAPRLRRLTIGLTMMRVVILVSCVSLATRLVKDIWTAESDPLLGLPLVVLGTIAVLYLLLVPIGVVAFASATAWGLTSATSESAAAGDGVRRAARARGGIWRLALARLAGSRSRETRLASLYEALMVFVVPAMIEERLTYHDAQHRSEQLVAARWGPGRFRATGIPRMVPADALYAYLVRTRGHGAAYIPALIALGLFGAPIAVALVTEDLRAAVAVGAVTWGVPIVAGTLWAWAVQPMLDGLLRGHLYVYALTGRAVGPYEAALLHSCLREEARATFAKPQRPPVTEGIVGERAATGLGGVLRRTSEGGFDYLQREAGIGVGDVGEIVRDGRELFRNNQKIMDAVRASSPDSLTADEIARVSSLAVPAVELSIGLLVDQHRLIRQEGADGQARYVAATTRPLWWERLFSRGRAV